MSFQFSIARLLLAVAAFAAVLGGMRPLGDASLPEAVIAACAVAGAVLVADMSAGLPKLLSGLFGWICYGVVCGAFIGFALNDLRAAMHGSSWYGRFAPDDRLGCMIAGLISGTVGGVVLEFVSHEYKWTRRPLLWVWTALPLIALIYYPLIRPLFDYARE